MSNRPFGSRDWNNNGEYDLFDKVTDRYIYDKVTHSEKKDTHTPYTPTSDYVYETSSSEPKKPKEKGATTLTWIIIFFVAIFFIYLDYAL